MAEFERLASIPAGDVRRGDFVRLPEGYDDGARAGEWRYVKGVRKGRSGIPHFVLVAGKGAAGMVSVPPDVRLEVAR